MTIENLMRPSRTSMEGMIWNANHVLEQALNSGYNGIPKTLFHDCRGIVLISIVDVGFIFSGHVGTGILLKKKKKGYVGTWSPPAAVGVTGLGLGFLIGASVKDVIIFLMDDGTVDGFTMTNQGLKLGSQVELTLGPFGRNYELDTNVSGQGWGPTVSVAFTKGAFAGINIEGAVVGSRDAVNSTFYGRPITPKDILNAESAILPSDKLTLLDDVYHKLDLLVQGKKMADDTATSDKKAAAAEAAEKASEQVHTEAGGDVVHVDAAAEATKEVTK